MKKLVNNPYKKEGYKSYTLGGVTVAAKSLGEALRLVNTLNGRGK